jgi:Fic family protein
MKLSEKLNIIMDLEGSTQEKLAQRLGVSFATLNSWINGRSTPRSAAQKRIDQLYHESTGHREFPEEALETRKRILLANSRKYRSTLQFILENPDIRDQLLLSLTYNTNRIEGSTLSESETAAVMFDNTALPNKTLTEQLEVKNHQAALNYLFSYLAESRAIDEVLVLKLHGMLLNGIRQDAGRYRRHPVRIVGANIPTANYVKIPTLMNELIEKIEKREKDVVQQIAVTHSEFERIHPFSDGNGRIGRLIIQAMSLRENYPPAIILQKRKRRYNAVLNKAQRTGETAGLEEFLCQALLTGLRLLERK